jgi:hypothetical protein
VRRQQFFNAALGVAVRPVLYVSTDSINRHNHQHVFLEGERVAV